MSDIILVTHWTGGDVFPFMRFGKLLKNEGHKVTILTHCVYEKKAREMGLDFVAVDTKEEYENINRDMINLSDPIGKKEDYLKFHILYHGKERLLREVKLIESICTSESIIIARHRSSISGLLAAERKHLPYASMILAPNYFSHMELHDQIFGKELCEEINKARADLNLKPISNWKKWLYSPQYILCGWPKWYANADETWPECAYPIGFIESYDVSNHFVVDKEISEFISRAKDKNQKIAIVTGGSSRMVSKDFYNTAIQACIIAGLNAIVVTPYKEYIPEDIPDTIKWACNVPLKEIMKEADIVIHHGGMGTINEAIDVAIPQIVMPHLTDGPDNADRLVGLGIATKFPPKMWNATLIADGIKEQLDDEAKSLCIRYKDMNIESYSARLGQKVISQIAPYVLPEQEQNTMEIKEENISRKQLSKKMLLELIKKRQEKNE